MTKIEKQAWIELLDACMGFYANGMDFTCAMKPYYATLKLVKLSSADLLYLLFRLDDDRYERASAIRFGMHNLNATRPKGITNEVGTG